MPVNAPRRPGDALNGKQGIPVTLPSTVEEHFWGAFGTRPYNKFERKEGRRLHFPTAIIWVYPGGGGK